MYHQLPQTEQIELHNTKSYSEVDRFIQTINCILSGDLDSEEVLTTILKQTGEYLDLDRIIIYQLKENSFRVEKQWIANNGTIAKATDLIIKVPDILTFQDNNLQTIWEEQLRELDNNNFVAITKPIFLGKNLFGILVLQKLVKKDLFTTVENYVLQRITEQLAIYFKQEIRLKQISLNQHNNQIIANLSHEFRTPLTAILGFTNMLKKQIYGDLNAKQLEYITAIYDSGQHLLALSNDLLDLAKIEAEKEYLFLEEIVIKEICQEILEIFEEKAKEQGLELIFLKEYSGECCRGDRRRIKQILVNLVSNAIKFTEKGTITLRVKTVNKTIEFAVIDTGIGIKEEDREKLFKPFSQIFTPLHFKHKGTGLGLTLSRKLAQLHGGDIKMQSTAGKGSCFTLYLPNLEVDN